MWPSRPTAISTSADGYGNARIHQFDADGRLLFSWGEPGAGPGQFHVPHGIAIDRHGHWSTWPIARTAAFSASRPTGNSSTSGPTWPGPARSSSIAAGRVFVAELGYRAGMFPGNLPPSPDATGGRVSIFSTDGRTAGPLGRRRQSLRAGRFFRPARHLGRLRAATFTSAKSTTPPASSRGLVGPDSHTLQKFIRVPTDIA